MYTALPSTTASHSSIPARSSMASAVASSSALPETGAGCFRDLGCRAVSAGCRDEHAMAYTPCSASRMSIRAPRRHNGDNHAHHHGRQQKDHGLPEGGTTPRPRSSRDSGRSVFGGPPWAGVAKAGGAGRKAGDRRRSRRSRRCDRASRSPWWPSPSPASFRPTSSTPGPVPTAAVLAHIQGPKGPREASQARLRARTSSSDTRSTRRFRRSAAHLRQPGPDVFGVGRDRDHAGAVGAGARGRSDRPAERSARP